MTLVKRFIFHLIIVAIGMLIVLNSFPIFALAAASGHLEVSGWIPYWRDSQGIADARKHIGKLDTVNPFEFSVKNDGTLKDLYTSTSTDLKRLLTYAHSHGSEVIPTVMWSDGTAINAVLSSNDLRAQHEDAIVSMVKKGKYDGVDIDYEGKLSATKANFSLFLKELKAKLGSKTLTCAIEPRTPPDSLFTTVPATIEYANDYKAIGTYCDRVEIMAYDQQRADIKLDAARQGAPYIPLSDVDWVEKVIKLAIQDIPPEKIMLGVPTYGHQYTVTVFPQWYKDYARVGSLNLPDALDLSKQYKVTPGRNAGGEMSFAYFPAASVFKILSGLPVPQGTQRGFEAAAQALLYANYSGASAQFNVVWYSDAGAVERKVALAKKYGLRGIALFKIDGQEDQNIWNVLK